MFIFYWTCLFNGDNGGCRTMLGLYWQVFFIIRPSYLYVITRSNFMLFNIGLIVKWWMIKTSGLAGQIFRPLLNWINLPKSLTVLLWWCPAWSNLSALKSGVYFCSVMSVNWADSESCCQQVVNCYQKMLSVNSVLDWSFQTAFASCDSESLNHPSGKTEVCLCLTQIFICSRIK